MSEEKKLTLKIQFPMRLEIEAESKEDALMKLGEAIGDTKERIVEVLKQRGVEIDEDFQKLLDNLTVEESYIEIDDIKVTAGKEFSRDVN